MGLVSLEPNSAIQHVVGCWDNRSRPTTHSQGFNVDVQGSTPVLTVSPILRLAIRAGTEGEVGTSSGLVSFHAGCRGSSWKRVGRAEGGIRTNAEESHLRASGPEAAVLPSLSPDYSLFSPSLAYDAATLRSHLPHSFARDRRAAVAKASTLRTIDILASVPMSPLVQCIQGSDSMKRASRKYWITCLSNRPPSHPIQ